MGVPGGVERDGRGPPGELGGVEWVGPENGRPSKSSGRGWEAIQKGCERSGGPPGVTGVVRMDERGRESLLECWEGQEALSKGQEGVGVSSG